MFTIGPVGFLVPALLTALIALPILWLLLRAVPPAPLRQRFPGVALLLGLKDKESQSDKTPWWLLLLRMLAVAAAIIGFSGPVLNPQTAQSGQGALLILVDGTWASARDWARRIERIDAALDEAAAQARPVAIVQTTAPLDMDLPFQAANSWKSRLPGLTPRAWDPDAQELLVWANGLDGVFDTFWMSDGLARDGRGPVLEALENHGTVSVYESPRPVYGLRPARFENGQVLITALRAAAGAEVTLDLSGVGLDPNGIERNLVTAQAEFGASDVEAEVALVLPPELRNRITRFALSGVRSAGAVSLTDDSLRRREVALIAGRDAREGLELLSPLHYLRQALEPTADILEGAMADLLLANPDAIIFADVAEVPLQDQAPFLQWLEGGGVLVRFAGPRLAASEVSRSTQDPLMPVRLRAGGRNVGGAMSWGAPKTLRPFDETSPFFGLDVPDDVNVTSQVVAQPDPALADRAIAVLTDGTPLVTRQQVGQGQIVLFHVTANAEWSSLPLSGLFVQMLERLAVSTQSAPPGAQELAGTTWAVETSLNAFGDLEDAATLPGVPGDQLAQAMQVADTSRLLPPGLYAGDDRRLALNVISADHTLTAMQWPERIDVQGVTVVQETALKGWFLTAAAALLVIDILASLLMTGRMRRGLTVALALFLVPPSGEAQVPDDIRALEATSGVVLAYVRTGDTRIDALSFAGLRGLSVKLFERTSVEPLDPVAVDVNTDSLSLFPFLYWPVTEDQALPDATGYAKLNRYLRSGGMILFDTRDGDVAQFGGNSPNGRMLQRIAGPLNIPPLEPVPKDHVLTRTFYLLQEFPGRHNSQGVWVEAAPPDAEQVDGMPFRNLNDGVTPVVIGGNDWAAAWAVDERGVQQFPVGRGYAGERQREISYRFGINLIMHVLTGNYKSDQVHVPALLDRLGQ